VTVNRTERGDGQQNGEMGWSVRRGDGMVSRMGRGDGLAINIPPLHILRCASSRTSFKGGEVMVNRAERGDGQQNGEIGWSVRRGDGMVSRMGRGDGQ